MPPSRGPNGWQARQRTIKMSLSVQKFCLYQASSVAKKFAYFTRHKTWQQLEKEEEQEPRERGSRKCQTEPKSDTAPSAAAAAAEVEK